MKNFKKFMLTKTFLENRDFYFGFSNLDKNKCPKMKSQIKSWKFVFDA